MVSLNSSNCAGTFSLHSTQPILLSDDVCPGDQGLGGQTAPIGRDLDRDRPMLPIAADCQIRHQGVGIAREVPEVIYKHEHDRSHGQLDGHVRTEGAELGQEQHQEDREARGRRRDIGAAMDKLQSDIFVGWLGVLDESHDTVLQQQSNQVLRGARQVEVKRSPEGCTVCRESDVCRGFEQGEGSY